MACGIRDLLVVGAFSGSLVISYWYREGKPFLGNENVEVKESKGAEEGRSVSARSTPDRETKPMSFPSFPKGTNFTASASVSVDRPDHVIPDAIYGVCTLPAEKIRELGIPVTRWGGNTSTRYNWKINAHNGGKDWFFFNRGEPIRDPSENGYVRTIKSNQNLGATAYLTVPMIGWVAKDHSSASFSVRKYGKQQRVEPWNSDVGNGISHTGKPIRENDPRDSSIEVSPEFVAEAVSHVLLQAGPASANQVKKGVAYWVLDNEPMLWHETHADVRKDPLGYDELWERTVAYAEAIKKVDPTAKVAGFCSWGWTDLFYSAQDKSYDNYATRPDFKAHNGMPLAEWFIAQCGNYKKKHGKALIDVFDFHWYPQCKFRDKTPYDGKGSDLVLNELRLRSTRDLWDPGYEQESWCKNSGDRQPTALIRRAQRWIEKYNPGMELAIGEYNFGGADNITGALAQADVFGIMSREKVDLGFIWSTPEGSQLLAWQLFRNYDGKGGRFGDEYLPCRSDREDIAIYAARRTKDGARTIVLLNKNLGGDCTVKMDVPQLKGKMRIWRFDQTGKLAEVECEAGTVEDKISLTLPAASGSILVVD